MSSRMVLQPMTPGVFNLKLCIIIIYNKYCNIYISLAQTQAITLDTCFSADYTVLT